MPKLCVCVCGQGGVGERPKALSSFLGGGGVPRLVGSPFQCDPRIIYIQEHPDRVKFFYSQKDLGTNSTHTL